MIRYIIAMMSGLLKFLFEALWRSPVICVSAIAAQAPMAALSPVAIAQSAAPFSLKPLTYNESALAPVIDAQTMQLHHGKHHKAYVDALNKAVAADPKLQNLSLQAMLENAGALPSAVRNNAGGHWNHEFFWETMTRPDAGGLPSPALAKAIDDQCGSLQSLKEKFKTAGLGRFGSGWAWLIVKSDGSLAITSTPNQDNPLMDVADVKGVPILGNDVWEHAYYLTYQNKRADYLDAWWRVVNWQVVSARYTAAFPLPC